MVVTVKNKAEILEAAAAGDIGAHKSAAEAPPPGPAAAKPGLQTKPSNGSAATAAP